ncbi:phosphoenolpyruvate mutase [Shewanella surugensis]|uniref:phosphoenolpyruvate mutase n=1 Tax=Shewanella surugensis TaxID=212020 RepID=A0ABT0LI21_9GAMM|nr:phosphoenolpyruvate mutase [Shewanella surugensis]MCL1127224.1 phosphoenolpyruvate mutase [Shewanella surugensis]
MKALKGRKIKQLKNLLQSKQLEFICEAHDGLSAKIVEETGFSGIWGSGLAISASLGVRDSNEASWTQVLEVLEFMSDATRIPILLDGDTGYGNFNNLRRLVKKLESRNIAGVCIEDKLFPKTNSFIDGQKQKLADIDEFCGKIKAGKDIQLDDDFSIVARTEAFIVGAGLSEALHRAESYRQAGADAILVHSKKSTDHEISLFMQEWADRCPIIIVPTTYYSTPTDNFSKAGISMVIWANHLLRASVKAMQHTAGTIYQQQSLRGVEDNIVPVKEIFRLQGAEELQQAEEKYLPQCDSDKITSVILAASRGEELGKLTLVCPKALLPINGKPILHRYIEELQALNIYDISVVRGYQKQQLDSLLYKTFDNDAYETTDELFSLYQARESIQGHCIISYGDCLYRRFVLQKLLSGTQPITVVVNRSCDSNGYLRDMAYCSNKTDIPTLTHINLQIENTDAAGEWAGIVKLTPEGSILIRRILEQLSSSNKFEDLNMADLLNILTEKTTVEVIFIDDGWLNVNTAYDLLNTGEFQC